MDIPGPAILENTNDADTIAAVKLRASASFPFAGLVFITATKSVIAAANAEFSVTFTAVSNTGFINGIFF